MNKRNTSKTETTIATRTLRSHPWHDVHSITHRQMADRAPEGCFRIQMIDGGVRVVNNEGGLSDPTWNGDGRAWMRDAIVSCDPFHHLHH